MPAQLHFHEIAPDQPFHAALVTQRGAYGEKTLVHTHDFWELMYVAEGCGSHWLGGEPFTLSVGDLLLIRPQDVHAVRVSAGQTLHFLNIAFLEGSWRDFCLAARLTPEFARWAAAAHPLSVSVPHAAQGDCAEAFRRALGAFVKSPSYLELCRLWCTVVPLFAEPSAIPPAASGASTPVWLARACQKMQDAANLRAGLPRLNTLCGVSQAHLARTVKHHYGQTPTEFVNDLRLERAATLLTTTSEAIAEVAADCGFDNLSYFYRCFSRRFGCPPRAFRVMASKQVVPKAQP